MRIVGLFSRNWNLMVNQNRIMSNKKGLQLHTKLQPFLCAVVFAALSPSPLHGESGYYFISRFPHINLDGDSIKEKNYFSDSILLLFAYFVVFLSTLHDKRTGIFIQSTKKVKQQPFFSVGVSSTIRQAGFDLYRLSFFCMLRA